MDIIAKKIRIIILTNAPLSFLLEIFHFWHAFKKCSLAHFEYRESFGQYWVKIAERSRNFTA